MSAGLLVPRRGEHLLPALSGALLVLAFPPFHLLVPPFLALVPLAWWVARLDPGADGGAAAARGGLVFGVVHFGLLLHWIVPALAWVTALAVPAFLAVLGLLGGIGAGVTWVLHRAVHRVGAPIWLALPVSWTAGEWVRAHLPGGLSFPWLELGTALTGFPELAGTAELVGTRGLSFWMAGVNGLVAAALLGAVDGRARAGNAAPLVGGVRAGNAAPITFIGLALLAAGLPAGWGVWRAGALEVAPAARVAVIQPNVPADLGRRPDEALRRTHEALDTLLGTPTAVDLVVLPEGAFPFDLRAPEAAASVAALSRHAAAVGAPLLVGAYGAPEPGHERLNSAFLVTAAGLLDAPYHKRRLVPLVEHGPIGGFGTRTTPAGAVGAADESGGGDRDVGVRSVGPVAIGISICYEAVFGAEARRARAAGADILVNVTNDAWYGDASGGGRTVALRQHPAHLVMRAIETRAGAVRAANTGMSIFVDPIGHVHDALPVSEAGVTVAEVRTTDELTLFVRFGDLVGRAAALSALLLVVWPTGRRGGGRRDRGRTAGPAAGGSVAPGP